MLRRIVQRAGAAQFRNSTRPLRAHVLRSYATLSPHTPPPTTPYEVFDEPSKNRQRDRAIIRLREEEQTAGPRAEDADVDPVKVVDYLREEVSERLAERVEDLRTPPASILELAAHSGQLTQILQEVIADEVPSASESRDQELERRKWWIVESSTEALQRDDDSHFSSPPIRIQASASRLLEHPEIEKLKEQVEAVVSGGGLHWVGDIVGALTQIRHLLKPDGVFVGAVLGGDTLFELRTSLQLAEQERRGGIANRISPMINPTDAPSLLNRAGFTLTTIDVEDMTINYPSIWELVSDLRDMGESNAILGRRAHVSRDVLLAADAIYKELYGNEDGSVPATFQIIFLIGWKPGPNQPKALERGSATTSLKDVL
ncbi:uncharacterized protein I303_107336 [Kwoniella dejecticola CBS 10117]|uniref:Methyltransferase type 11 domain-containing protein n=1 Tax=Kwoniella dejecticola CBS 10117 TaxID=1296121 RepID=A0A1A5ZZE0_9TREE|nr:uncharacterized protein I303_06741 [Kwoniella dejecticola CBS 10117]OBR83182.1 hypothetical protein I303_06741 [Kwoniella dejecticola CBS 10117]